MLDEFNSHLRSLKTLGRPTDYWDDIIVFMIVSRFDAVTRAKWRDAAPINALPTLKDVSTFLTNRCYVLNTVETVDQAPHEKSVPNRSSRRPITSLRSSTTVFHCENCNTTGHSIMRCHIFQALSVGERIKRINELNLCSNCFRTSHRVDQCNVKEYCRVCKAKHHTLIHTDNSSSLVPPPPSNTTQHSSTESTSTSASNSVLSTFYNAGTYTFVATAVLDVMGIRDKSLTARALLDSGSQAHFITKSFAMKLGIKISKPTSFVNGIGHSNVPVFGSVVLEVRSRLNNFSARIETLIVSRISDNQPSMPFEHNRWPIPSNIRLADPRYGTPSPIELLIGNDLVPDLQSVGQIKLGEGLPTLQNTLLGWVVVGSCSTMSDILRPICNLAELKESSENLECLIERFWRIEEPEDPPKTRSDNDCESHFTSSYSRDPSGRFVVRLPFEQPVSTLGESCTIARKRFLNLESRLERNSAIRESYNAFMQVSIARIYEACHIRRTKTFLLATPLRA